jgi:putative membrane protein insertion efficiency factor
MGHCDSSTQFGGHGEFSGASPRAAEADPSETGGRNSTGAEFIRERSIDSPVAQSFPSSSNALIARTSTASWVLLLVLRVYKAFLSPFFGGACKYHPSCSNYAYEAIQRHGSWTGSVLALKRLLRCRPFTRGGFDPVPSHEELQMAGAPSRRAGSF